MAGDWIKFEIATPDKPEIWAIAERLNIDPDAVIGKLLRVWAWFDQHTENGNAPSVTKSLLDRSVGVVGFCDSVISAGWMTEKNNNLTLPNFDRHNGKTAKNRALTAKRVANCNANAKVTPDALPREEKRRDKENIKKKIPVPDDFEISDGVRKWAERKKHTHLEEHLENFVLTCQSKGYVYLNLDRAFQRAIRDDWAKVNNKRQDEPYNPGKMLGMEEI